jgi:hypothetical protein
MTNHHHSDLTVSIFSTINALIDPSLLVGEYQDPVGRVSAVLSANLNQSWLLHNALNEVDAQAFHTSYLQSSQAVQNSYLSVLHVDPQAFCATEADLETWIHSILTVNRVLKKKVLLFANAEASSGVARQYADFVADHAEATTNNLVCGHILEANCSVERFRGCPAQMDCQRMRVDFICSNYFAFEAFRNLIKLPVIEPVFVIGLDETRFSNSGMRTYYYQGSRFFSYGLGLALTAG